MEANRPGPASSQRGVHSGVPCWTRLSASGEPGHLGARPASSARAGIPGTWLSRPARPPPQPPTSDPESLARTTAATPQTSQTRPERRCAPRHLPALTAHSLASSSHLTGRQPRVGTSADAYTLSLQQVQLGPPPRTPMGRRSRARARVGTESKATAATSTGSVPRQGAGASGYATLAPPKKRVGPAPRWLGAGVSSPAWDGGRGLDGGGASD